MDLRIVFGVLSSWSGLGQWAEPLSGAAVSVDYVAQNWKEELCGEKYELKGNG